MRDFNPAPDFQAFRDVWRNPHARLLIVVTFIEQVGSAAIGVLTLYVTQYVVGAPLWAPVIILCYMVPSSLSVPMWLPLSRRFGKVRLWMFSMLLTGVSFGASGLGISLGASFFGGATGPGLLGGATGPAFFGGASPPWSWPSSWS